MKKLLKRLLMFVLLLPVLPVFGIPDGGSSDTKGDEGEDKDGGDKDGGDTGGKDNKGDDDGKKGKDNKGDDDGKKGKDNKGDMKGQDKLFTQDELDAVLARRLKRERDTWKQTLEDEKKKAAMTESERLKAEKEEAEKKAVAATERANQRLIRSEVIAQASKMNIVDPDAAFTLLAREGITVEEDDSVKGVKEALALLVKAKPYLVKTEDKRQTRTGDDQGDDKDRKGGISMNSLIRRAAGRE